MLSLIVDGLEKDEDVEAPEEFSCVSQQLVQIAPVKVIEEAVGGSPQFLETVVDQLDLTLKQQFLFYVVFNGLTLTLLLVPLLEESPKLKGLHLQVVPCEKLEVVVQVRKLLQVVYVVLKGLHVQTQVHPGQLLHFLHVHVVPQIVTSQL